MSQNGFLTRWKTLLDSKDPGLQSIALLEIAEIISDEKSETSSGIGLTLINSDAFHFISRIMSYQQRSSLILINKIVCHLSHVPQFYDHDFFRILRGFANVLNSFPTTTGSCDKDKEYQRNILFSLNYVIKRGFDHKCNFSSRDMPLNCFVSNVASLHEARLCNPTALETVNLTIKLMIAVPCPGASKFRDEKVLEVATKLNMQRPLLESVAYSAVSSQLLQNLVNFIAQSAEKQSTEQELIQQEVVDKFLSLMDFASLRKIKIEHFEIFCVLMFFLLVSDKVSNARKMKLVARFFTLKGHWKLVSMVCGESEESKPPLRSKVRLLLSQVLFVFLKFISESVGVAEVTTRTCFRIVANADLRQMCPVQGDHRIETTLMFIFMKYVDSTHEKSAFAASEVLSNLAFFLATTRDQIEPPFQILLTKLFTASYSDVQIDGNFLLPIASVELQKLPKSPKTIDLHFLRWWKEAGNPCSEVFDKAVMEFLKLCDSSQLICLQTNQLRIFDRKLVLEAFLGNPEVEMHTKLTSVLCQLQTKDQMEFHRLLGEFKKVSKSRMPQKICNVLAVMDCHNGELGSLMKKLTAKVMLDFLKKSEEFGVDLKILALGIATKLMRIGN